MGGKGSVGTWLSVVMRMPDATVPSLALTLLRYLEPTVMDLVGGRGAETRTKMPRRTADRRVTKRRGKKKRKVLDPYLSA